MIIRPMQPDDVVPLSAIVALNYNRSCAEAFIQEAGCAFYNYPFKPRFLVAGGSNHPIGCVCWNTDWCSWGVYNLSWLQVAPAYKGEGIGTRLMQAALTELKPLAKLVLLSTTKPGYHERFGFKTVQRYQVQHEYDREGGIECLMALEMAS